MECLFGMHTNLGFLLVQKKKKTYIENLSPDIAVQVIPFGRSVFVSLYMYLELSCSCMLLGVDNTGLHFRAQPSTFSFSLTMYLRNLTISVKIKELHLVSPHPTIPICLLFFPPSSFLLGEIVHGFIQWLNTVISDLIMDWEDLSF